jgi:hypothetical protein
MQGFVAQCRLSQGKRMALGIEEHAFVAFIGMFLWGDREPGSVLDPGCLYMIEDHDRPVGERLDKGDDPPGKTRRIVHDGVKGVRLDQAKGMTAFPPQTRERCSAP